jgi:membrane carboxypeptidase/penicillin-binding protein
VREAKLASELENEHPKDWILTSYLNNVPYGTVNGETAVGIESAAEIFFSKHAKDLTLDQAAVLAGLPQAPSDYNPFKNPSAALARRNEVLRAMVKNHYLTPARAAAAMNKPLKLRAGNKYFRRSEPYFFDYVSELLIEKYGLNTYRRGGLRVYTTIDPTLQQAARQAIANQLNQPNDPSSAVVSIEGKVKKKNRMLATKRLKAGTETLSDLASGVEVQAVPGPLARPLLLSLTFAAFSVAAFAQAKLDFQPADTIKTILDRQSGQRVELRLKSGEKLAGKVEKLGDKVVHLSAITGQEFFEAVVVLDDVTAVLVKTK